MDWLGKALALIVGAIIGVTGDRALVSIGRRRTLRQSQRTGDNATLTQVAGNMHTAPTSKPPKNAAQPGEGA